MHPQICSHICFEEILNTETSKQLYWVSDYGVFFFSWEIFLKLCVLFSMYKQINNKHNEKYSCNTHALRLATSNLP
jgi:hypothetical protein